MLYPSQTFISLIVLLPWFNVLFVFLYSKFRHLLPAPMDCMVPSVFIHQQSMVLETVTRFISASPQCFTEDDHPLRHGSSFNKQKLWGGMIAIYVTQVFVFITCIAVIFTFDGLMVLLISVLKYFVLTGHFILSALSFVSVWTQNMFHVCCCSQHECSFFIDASLHSTKDYHENYST